MRRFLWGSVLLGGVFGCTGCMGPLDPHDYQFQKGDKVEIVVNHKEAIIVDRYMKKYTIRYSDDNGVLRIDHVNDFEVKEIED